MNYEKKSTGRPSEDRRWMQYYPDMMLELIKRPSCTVWEYLEQHCPGPDIVAIHYYGEDITWRTVFEESEKCARSLRAMGFGEGDQIPVFFRLVPNFVFLLLAAEKIGASILCRDNTLLENVEAVSKADAKAIFAHDFLSQKELRTYCEGAGVRKVILLDPMYYGHESTLPDYIKSSMDEIYPRVTASGENTMSWDEFLSLGNYYVGRVEADIDLTRPLFRAYTSGSTGPSKQVIHCANSILGTVCQMNFYGGSDQIRPTWMVTCLPPALVAVVVSMVMLPLSSNKLLIMDPFVDPEDVDLEMMRYRPNGWPMIPMFIELVMRNGRVPKDYDMSHLLAAGAGCEAVNNNQLDRVQNFLEEHNCHVRFTVGYGSSEGGSNLTFQMSPKSIHNGNVGIPMPLTDMSVFKPGTQEELGYNEMGEICASGPGIMLGYDRRSATAKALQTHADGKLWLHTGDIGYVDEDGIFYVLNRGAAFRYGGGELAVLPMENRLADAKIPGIRDEFFVLIEDEDHDGYFVPYLYVVLEDGYSVDDIIDDVQSCLEPYMFPVEILAIDERPFFHFKTNRIELSKELKKRKYDC